MPRIQRRHLTRLDRIYTDAEIYFLTIATARRLPLLARPDIHEFLRGTWQESKSCYGWLIGRYVIMPDHVHFFGVPLEDAKTLSDFLRDWKRFTSRGVAKLLDRSPPIWQREGFDHLLRSDESYAEKWEYVRENPVRAGLVKRVEDWAFAGEVAEL